MTDPTAGLDTPGKFVEEGDPDGEAFEPSSCSTCRHKVLGTATCAAFPKRIPREILQGEHDHTTAFPGDHGIRYEQGEPSAP